LHPGRPKDCEICVDRQPGTANDPASRSINNDEVHHVEHSEGEAEQLQPPTVEDVHRPRRFSIEVGFFKVAFDGVNHVGNPNLSDWYGRSRHRNTSDGGLKSRYATMTPEEYVHLYESIDNIQETVKTI
jgi:hypothetical protein